MGERCALCGCSVHRSGEYAKPTIAGRSHATKHHFIAERFFGRSGNRPKEIRQRIFFHDPWNFEGRTEIFCYECHEELLHNPVFLLEDIRQLSNLVKKRGLNEDKKTESREKIAGRIKLLHEALSRGIKALIDEEKE